MSTGRFESSRAKEFYNAAMQLLSLENPGLSKEDIQIANLTIANVELSPEEFLFKAASLNYPAAMVEYAIYLLQNKKNQAKNAVFYLNAALKAGWDSPLLFGQLGVCAYKGTGMPVDKKLAIRYFETAIATFKKLKNTSSFTKRFAEALALTQYALGVANYSEVSNARKKPKLTETEKTSLNKLENLTMSLLAQAESGGSLDASHHLATIYIDQSNDGTRLSSQDPKSRMGLQKLWLAKLKTLAEKGYCHAEYDLANYYHHSQLFMNKFVVVEDNPEVAIKFYWRAALHGKLQAYNALLNIYTEKKDSIMRDKVIALGAHMGVLTCQYEKSLSIIDDPNAAPQDKKLAGSFIKDIADTDPNNQSHSDKMWYVDAQCRYALICVEAAETQENNQSLVADAITYFRKAVLMKHIQAKYFLANVLIRFNDKNYEKSFKEAKKLIDELGQVRNLQNNPGINDVLNQLDFLRSLYETELQAKRSAASSASMKSSAPKNIAISNNFMNNAPKKSSNYASLRQKIREKVPVDNSDTATPSVISPSIVDIPNVSIPPLDESATVVIDIPEEKLVPIASPPKSNPYQIVATLPCRLSDEVIGCMKALIQQGHVAYVVGGMVRNNLSKRVNSKDDADIVTDAPIEVIESIAMKKQHDKLPGLCRYTFNNIQFDIKSVSDLKDNILRDAMSRDFTINALYANIDHRVMDPTGNGLQDLADTQCQLKSITSHRESFAVDPFRILRYLKFRASGLLGDISCKDMALHLSHFSDLFNSFKKTQGLSIEEKTHLIEQGSVFKEKLNFIVCQLFMSGNAVRAIKELLAYNFFENFYPGIVFDAGTRRWLIQRFEEIDELINHPHPSYAVTSAKVYEILIAAMLNPAEKFSGNYLDLFDKYPLPSTLRWKLKEADIAEWFNDRKYYLAIPNLELLQGQHTNFHVDHQAAVFPTDHSHSKYAKLFPSPVYQNTPTIPSGFAHFSMFNHPVTAVQTHQPSELSLRS